MKQTNYVIRFEAPHHGRTRRWCNQSRTMHSAVANGNASLLYSLIQLKRCDKVSAISVKHGVNGAEYCVA